MNAPLSQRLLSIGEFAAATQLSPKALRIYDEQQLLAPARIDAATGYRFYSGDQVAVGRLIRALREMGISLAAVSTVVATRESGAEALLAELAQELDYRYARERHAYHAALLLLRNASAVPSPDIVEYARAETLVVVEPFLASRYDFMKRFRSQVQATCERLAQADLTPFAQPSCALVDPLSDDDGRLELLVPITPAAPLPNDLTLRRLPAAACAAITAPVRHSHASELTGALDALFDWLDRHGCRAIEPPLVTIQADGAGLRTDIARAFERPTA